MSDDQQLRKHFNNIIYIKTFNNVILYKKHLPTANKLD